jgi:hypothetical protein
MAIPNATRLMTQRQACSGTSLEGVPFRTPGSIR